MSELTASLLLGEVARALRSGSLDLVEHIEALCDRIEAVEPQVHAFLPERDRRARLMREARALLRDHPDPSTRPLLFGVAVAVKDIFAVDGFETRCGSALPAAAFAWEESTAVGRMRAAGALILGKTVTTEFAYRDAGATSNPHAPNHTPGGSSAGSAAAVAAGAAPLALGTQTGGSIIRPATYCGVVGFKPTYGRVPLEGVLPFAPSMDTVGVFSQDVDGAALAASVLCDGWDPESERGGRPATVGVPNGRYLARAEDAARSVFEESLTDLSRAGCVVRRVEVFDGFDAIVERQEALQAAEFAESHGAWFGDYGALYGANSVMMIERGRAIGPESVIDLRAGRAVLRERLEDLMESHELDVWVCPAAPGPAPEGLAYTGDHVMNLPWSYAGLPAVTIPAGELDGLPLGVQIVAQSGADEALLSYSGGIAEALRT